MFELPLPPQPGEVLLYVELTQVQNMTIAQCLTMLQEIGYRPELRYRQWQDADGKPQFGMFALLKHEQHEQDFLVDSDYLLDEWEAIATRIEPSTAVGCPRGLPKRTAIAA